jgi:5-methylcytosine-specific restriction endonuclease McrA
VHHIVPRRNGGGDEDSNLRALCHACHSRVTAAGG